MSIALLCKRCGKDLLSGPLQYGEYCTCKPLDVEGIRESYAPGTKPHSESACSCDRCADWIDGRDLLTLVDTLTAEIRRLENDNAPAKEVIQELNAGKPLGPISGAHTIINQAAEIKRLENEVDVEKGWAEYNGDTLINVMAEREEKNVIIRELTAENKRLRDALQEVSRTLGPYVRDPHEFAVGVIEDMQDIALNALVDNWADLKEQDNE